MPRHVYVFRTGKVDGDASQKALLGGKGAGLAEMTRLGVPVPPGFTITTEVALSYASRGEAALDAPLRAEVATALAEIEAAIRRKLGDRARPLLVSVRSGARASMPGMLDTILNLGMNDEVAQTLGREMQSDRFAYDAYRRFVMMYSDVVLRVPRKRFDEQLDRVRHQVATEKGLLARNWNTEELQRRLPDSDIPAPHLKELVACFKEVVQKETGHPFPEDPMVQLWGAIVAVFESWNNPRAKIYRRMHGIPETWGTACSVQAMVFGNLGDDSATGVAFSRDPSTGERRFSANGSPMRKVKTW